MKGRSKPSIFRDVYHQPYSDKIRMKLYNSTKGSLDLIQRLRLVKKLPVHNGCVNSICWNETGEYILSGSDDQHLVVTHGYNYKVLTSYKTSHRANIFSAKFLPSCGDNNVISCSGDGIILFTDLMRREETYYNQFNCHSGTTYEIITIPNDPHSFLSCGEDGTVRWFDLRIKDKCTKPQCKEDVMITCPRAVTALSISPVIPYQLAIGCSDSAVRMYDRRMLTTKATGGTDPGTNMNPLCAFSVPSFEDRLYRITSLCFSPEGDELLVSYSSDHLYLFNVKDQGCMKLNSTPMPLDTRPCEEKDKRPSQRSPPPVRRLRLRGDWSDTGPDARPEREGGSRGEVAQARPTLHATLMQRMTDVLSRMLNDPATRAALSGGGEDTLEREEPQSGVQAASSSNNNEGTQTCESQTSEVAEFASPSISVPQLSSLSINSSDSDTNSLQPIEALCPIPSTSQDSCGSCSNTLDIAYAACEPEGPVNDFQQLDGSSNINPTCSESESERKSESTCDDPIASSSNECTIKEHSSDHECPRSDPGTEDKETDSSFSPNMKSIQKKICSLQDKLSTLREGFIERHGSEPAVQLTYSEKSTSKATISLGVADEVNRKLQDESVASTSALNENDFMDEMPTEPGPSKDSSSSALFESSPGPSHVSSTSHHSDSYMCSENRDYNSDDDDDEDDNDDDDDEEDDGDYVATGGSCRGSNYYEPSSEGRRYSHSIEEHMNNAIQNTRANCGLKFDDCNNFQPLIKQKYTGHRNARTMIKEATFWGDSYVLSGSDCGHVFIWDRYTGDLVMLLEADRHVVNCLQPHPTLPILATSGIDYDVKLWSPLHEEPNFDKDLAEVLTKRNEVMLEETKDTITVPASFMIRMLACLNQIRRGGRNRARNARQVSHDSNPHN